MNLENIQKIVNSGKENWDKLLLAELSKDRNVIPIMMQILDFERDNSQKIITESNSELSRALVTLMDDKYASKGQIVDRHWVAGEIKKHYLKWQKFIKCNFKIEGLP